MNVYLIFLMACMIFVHIVSHMCYFMRIRIVMRVCLSFRRALPSLMTAKPWSDAVAITGLAACVLCPQLAAL